MTIKNQHITFVLMNRSGFVKTGGVDSAAKEIKQSGCKLCGREIPA